MLAASVGYGEFPFDGNRALFLSGQAMALSPVRVRGHDFTFIANFRYDEVVPFGAAAPPVFERLFAGGDTATRGYEPDQLKTEVVYSQVAPLAGTPGLRIIPQGGNIRLLSTLEIQFPIAKTFFGLPWPWVGSVFYDVGAVLDAPNQVQVSDFKHAVGITVFRLLTTFGPLSLEYAYPITQSVAEQQWKYGPWYRHFPGRVHFNWGIPLSRL
jgi:outer membrane protein assembly factor BamA